MKDAMYEKFTATERVALMVDALARQDYVEADRIVDTCERKRYMATDAAYTQRFMGLHTLALFGRVMIMEEYAKASTALAMSISLSEKTAQEAKVKRLDWIQMLEDADRRIVGVWNAWQELCDKAGVDAQKAMSMGWAPIPGYFKDGLLAFVVPGKVPRPEPDAEAYESAKSLFDRQWDMIEERVLAAA